MGRVTMGTRRSVGFGVRSYVGKGIMVALSGRFSP
jgi:hypothetical protein